MRQQSAFETWMRTGWWPEPGPESVERKFNPWHDPENGRFTFAWQGKYFGRGRAAEAASPATQRPNRRLPARADGPSAQAMRAQLERIAREGRERDAFRKVLIEEEGDENVVYLDTNGFPTVGIGHKVTKADGLKLGDRITDAQKEALFRADSDGALRAARSQMREAGITDPSFLVPLASVNFQLGTRWTDKFVKTWALIKARKYGAAAEEVENSKWFREDSPDRVEAFQEALRSLERAERARLNRGRASR